MGIFINVLISNTVTIKEWESVYKKSLDMAQFFGLIDIDNVMIGGCSVRCAVPSHEIVTGYYYSLGWRTIGDRFSYKTAEDQFTPWDIGIERRNSPPKDALLSLVPVYTGRSRDDEQFNCCCEIWHNKTQGEPYHLYLLAIACMMEQELGIQAVADGDITRGQCVTASRLASDALGYKVPLPDRCDLQRLYDRVDRLPLTDLEKMEFFDHTYLGPDDFEKGNFIRQHFDVAVSEQLWKEWLSQYEVNTVGFSQALKKYFIYGYDLDMFCSILSDKIKSHEDCEKLLSKIMESHMYLEEKDCKDVFEIDKDAGGTYGILKLMGQLAFAGVGNSNIDRFIPLDEIRNVLSKYFSGICDTDSYIDEYLKKEEEKKDVPDSDMPNQYTNSSRKAKSKNYEMYDIRDYNDLPGFKPGDSIRPELMKAVIKAYNFYVSASKEYRYTELMSKGTEAMFSYVVEQNIYMLFLAEDWERIFSEIQENPNCFIRYYGMVRVEITGKLYSLVRAFVTNDAFWNLCETSSLIPSDSFNH